MKKALCMGLSLIFLLSTLLIAAPAMMAESEGPFVSFYSKDGRLVEKIAAADLVSGTKTAPSVPTRYGWKALDWNWAGAAEIVEDTDVYPNYTRKNMEGFDITVTGGTTTATTAAFEQRVTVTADDANAVWIDTDSGKIVSASSTYTFYASQDMKLTATTEAEAPEYFITTNKVGLGVGTTADKFRLSIVSESYVGAGHTITERGIIYTTKTDLSADQFVIGATGVTKKVASTTANGQYMYSLNGAPKATDIRARAYMIVDGTTVYSDVEGDAKFAAPVVSEAYDFADYEAGTQYVDEEHVLDTNTTLATHNKGCHFRNDGLRIYSSATNNGYVTITSKNPIASLTFNAGNNADTMNVYGVVDTVETLIEGVAVTSAYADHTVVMPEGTAYTVLKLDVAGTKQLRIKNITLTYLEEIDYSGVVEDTTCQHEYDAVVTEPTCTAKGYTTHTCSKCGDSYTDTETEMLDHTYVDGACSVCGAADPNATPDTPTGDIVFNLGDDDNTKSNSESSSAITTYTETNGNYTLTLSGMDKVYSKCYDINGNACLKLGSSSVVGTFTFTVPADVTSVKFEIAGRQTKTARVIINDVTYTIATASNDGYETITVDTTSTKEVVFTTVAKGGDVPDTRCMINSITFVTAPACEHTSTTLAAKDATCTEDGYNGALICDDCEAVVEPGEIVPALGHDYESVVTDPTCEEKGFTTHTCSACGDTYTDSETDMIPHNYEGGTCTACGAAEYTTPEAIVDAAYALDNDTALNGEYTLTGKITTVNTEYSSQYSNVTVTIVAFDSNGELIADKPIECYRLKGEGADTIGKGDIITVTGVLKKYGSKVEFDSGCTLGSEIIYCDHANTTTSSLEADCVTDGYNDRVVCDNCDEVLDEGELVEALGHNYVDGVCTGCGDTEVTVAKDPVTFEFGANGSAAHVDGNSLGSSKTYTEGEYTLTLTGMNKVYGPAYDAKGNSCIKLGTGSAAGSFSFTVADDVKSVTIRVAKYKANTSKIKVNGTSYTLSGASNSGAYDEIVVDTTVTKTVSFATVSGGYRCMINSITYNFT